jgi:peptidoglycan/xylan/chitin deacetylase (PgdA/CDA1 family)
MLREMAAAGMEIGSHGMRHRYLSTLTGAEAREEIFRSRELISEKTGAEVLSFAAVGGHMARRELEYAWEAGYRTFATMKPGITRLNSRNMVLKRNHFQAGNSKKRLRGIALGESWALSLGLLRYEGLMLPKKMLGLRGYDCLKSVLLGRKARRTLP